MNAIQGTRPLGALLEEYESLVVEDYQRPYTWDSEQIDDFYSDLLDSVRDKSHHFFGTLILQSTDLPGKVLIVDGQQRVTTTVILVATLRDHLLKLETQTIPATADRVSTYVPNKVYGFLLVNNAKLNPRFTPNRTIRPLMQECIFKEVSDGQKEIPKKSSTSTLKFRKASLAIRSKVAETLGNLEPNEKLVKIDELLTALLTRFHVLKVDTSTPGESLDIFLTLNNRGAPLGPSDLVRGEVLKRLGYNRSAKEIEKLHKDNLDTWTTIVEQVRDADVYLRHFLVATGREKVQKKKIVDKVVERISPSTANPDEQRQLTTEFWTKLGNWAEHYAEIVYPMSNNSSLRKPGFKYADEYLLLLEGLMKSHRILVLALLARRPGNDDLEELLRLICVYGFRYSMNGGNAQDLENRFQDWCQSYLEVENVAALKEKLTKAIENNKVDVQTYFEGDADADYVSRALLHLVNRYHSNKTWPLSDYHLEHIAPQTSTEAWVHELGAGIPVTAEVYEGLVSELGNLTLLDPETNWKIKNWEFSKKKSEYDKGPTNLTKDLLNFEYWTSEDIASRSQWLREMFQLLWSVEKPSPDQIVKFSTWLTLRTR